jgi:hypothetical protein
MHSDTVSMRSIRSKAGSSEINLTLFLLGSVISLVSYQTIEPIIAGLISYAAGRLLLAATPLGGHAESRMFNRAFMVGFLMAGVAAVYANQFGDANQLFNDAGGFFDMATDFSTDRTLTDIQASFESALVIVIWREVYDLFAALGFEKGRYIGISVNILAVSLSGVLGIKMLRQANLADDYRLRRLTLLVSSCGMFWLFAAIHLRDAVVLLGVTALLSTWMAFLAQPALNWRLVQVVLATLLALASFGFLRTEFVYVPVAVTFAAFTALVIGSQQERRHSIIVLCVLILGGVAAGVLALAYAKEILVALDQGRVSYAAHAGNEQDSQSLGMALIVNQPLPIQLILGSIYLYVFPIPFWSGIQIVSAYHVFKSANAIFFYLVMPLLAICMLNIWRNSQARTVATVFLLIVTVGFTLAIAGSSLETRHLGAVLMPLFVLASMPDMRVRSVRIKYRQYRSVVLSGAFMVHIAWIILKSLP